MPPTYFDPKETLSKYVNLNGNTLEFNLLAGGRIPIDLSSVVGSGFTVDGTPMAGQVPKYQSDGSVKWADDLTTGGGMADGVVNSLAFTKASKTFTLTASRTESLNDLTGTFQVGFLDIENTPTAWGSFWQVPAINTTRDGLFWITGPAGWAQRGNTTQIPIEKIGTGHVAGEMTRFLREDGTFVAPGGLNQAEVDARVNAGLDRLSFTKTNPGDTVRLLFQDSDGSPSDAVSLDHTDIGSTLRGLSHPAANKVLSYTSASTLPEWSHVEALLALVSGYGDGKVLTGRTNMSPTWQDPTGGGMDNRIVFPDAMGAIRPGTADDWDAPNSLSKVFAWTGNHLQRINRVPVPKTATFTPVPDGTNLGGTTNPRWRTFHHNDGQVPSPQNNDLYYNLTNNIFRYRQGGNWSNLSADHFAITGAGIVSGTLFADQPAALAFPGLTANDQRIMYGAGGTENLYTTSAFMAAHNSYPWQDVYSDWARSEDLSIIPQVKLGTGMATSSNFLRGDGQWAVPPGMGGSGEPEAFTDATYTFSVPLSSGTIRFTRANNTTFDLTMLMPFVNAQTVRNSIVEPWATRGESDLVPLSKLDGPVTSISNWTYNLGSRRQSLTVNRINEPNITLQGPVFPEWITASDVADWAEDGNTDDVPPVKLGSGVRDGTRFLRDDGAWSVLPNSLVTNLVSSWALVGDTTIIPQSKLPSFIVPVYDWAKAGNSDIIPTSKLGSGTGSSANFLRGDGTWQVITAGGGTPVSVVTETVKAIRYGNTYEVPGNVMESNSTNSAEHGLGKEPDGWEGYLECTTADKGYAVGDKVQWKPPPWRETVRFDATHTYVYTKNQGWGIINKGSTTGASNNIDLSDWKLVIKPFIYEDKDVVTGVTGGGGSGYDNFIDLDDTPASYGTAGQFVAINTSGNGLTFVNAPSGGGSGDDAFDWATVGNTDPIPTAKIPNLDANKITTGVFDYRRIAAGVFGASKVPVGNTAGTGLEWADLPTSYPGNDAIKDLIGASTFADDPLSVAYDGTTRTLRFTSTARTEAQVNTQIESRRDFEWCSATVTATSTAVTIALDGEGTAAVSTERILAINYISTFASTRPDSLPVFMTYNGHNSGNVQLFDASNNRRNMTLGDLRTYGHTNVMHMFRRRSGGWDWVGTSGAASVAQDVTSLIKSWALTANASTRVPVGQMGSGTASTSTWLRGDGSWQSLPALTDQTIATLVNGSPGNNRIIGYDTSDAGLRWYDLPTGGGMADGVVDDITHSISGQNLTLTLSRTNNLADISETIALPTSTDTNNYVTGGSVSGTTLTLTRQGLSDVAITGLPSGGGGTGTNVVANPTGTPTADLKTVTIGSTIYEVGFHHTIVSSDISYPTSDEVVRIANHGFVEQTDIIVFQYNSGTNTSGLTSTAELKVEMTGHTNSRWGNGGDRTRVKIQDLNDKSLRNMRVNDMTRYNIYFMYRAGNFWHFVGGTLPDVSSAIASWARIGSTGTLPTSKIPDLPTSVITSGTFSTARLGTGSPSSSNFLRGDGTWAVPPTGGGGGLTEAQVRALIADPAEEGNTTRWPVAKLGSGTADANRVLYGDGAWKLGPQGGGPGTVRYIPLTAISVTGSGTFANRQINLTLPGFSDSTGTIIYFHYFHNTPRTDDEPLVIRLNGGSNITAQRFRSDVASNMPASELVDNTMYAFERQATTWRLLGGWSQGITETWAKVNNTDDLPFSKLPITANPSGADTAFLDKLTLDSTIYKVRNTFDIDSTGQLPTASAQTEGQMYFNKSDRHIYVGIDDPHTQNTPSGTFNAITARTDLHVVTAFPANLNNLTAGDFYYLHAQGWNDGFYVVAVRYGVNELVVTSASNALSASRTSTSQGVVWLGAEQRATDALRFTYTVTSSSDYFWLDLGASPPTFKILDQSTFVAAGGTTHHYQFWRAGFVLPSGTAGQYLRLASDGVTPEFATVTAGGGFASWAAAGDDTAIPLEKIPFLPGERITSGMIDADRIGDLPTSKITSGVFDLDRIPTMDTAHLPTIPISKGGTGATTAAAARTALGALGSVATDNTIDGDGTTGNPLSVSVNDVIEELQESIQHFTSGDLHYSGRGATIGHCFTSGPFRTQISRVTVSLDVPNSGGTYVARIYTLESNNRIKTHLANSNTRNLSHRRNESFDFTAGGHTIPTNTRIAVLISRTDDGNDGDARMRFGAEASNSPSESYDDASIDFNRHGWVEYEHTNPPANQSTHNHDTDNSADVYGDMRIQYRRTFDHGTLVGDGNVDLATHVSGTLGINHGGTGATTASGARTNLGLGDMATKDDVEASDIDSGSATDGHVLTADGSGNASWEDAPGLAFSSEREVDIDITTTSQFTGTGFTGWTDKKVIFVSLGLSTTGETTSPSDTLILLVSELMAVNTASSGETVDQQGQEEDRNAIKLERLHRGGTLTNRFLFFGRTSSGELLYAQNFGGGEDNYPFRAIAL